jgi:hypothetical protein
MMATVRHVASSSGFRKFQAALFLLNTGYLCQPWTEFASQYFPAILGSLHCFFIHLSPSQNIPLPDAHTVMDCPC